MRRAALEEARKLAAINLRLGFSRLGGLPKLKRLHSLRILLSMQEKSSNHNQPIGITDQELAVE